MAGETPSERTVRVLTVEDLTRLAEPKPRKPVVARLKARHHTMARLVAAGLSNKAVAAVMGYTPARICHFTNDPSFLELVRHYQGDSELLGATLGPVDAYAAVVTQNGLVAEQLLQDILEAALERADAGEEVGLSVKELTSISRDAADRFGYGKQSTRFNVNADFAAALDKAIKRSDKIVEAQAVFVETVTASTAATNVVPLPSRDAPSHVTPREAPPVATVEAPAPSLAERLLRRL